MSLWKLQSTNNTFTLFWLLLGTCTRLIGLDIVWLTPEPELRTLISKPMVHRLSGWNLPRLTMFNLTVSSRQDASHMDLNIFHPFTKGIEAIPPVTQMKSLSTSILT